MKLSVSLSAVISSGRAPNASRRNNGRTLLWSFDYGQLEVPTPPDLRQTSVAPALTFVLTLRPRVTVWLWFCVSAPDLTLVLTFKPRAAVWLWLKPPPPALTFVLIFICPSP